MSAIGPQGFAIGQKIKQKNLINGSISGAQMIWRGHKRPSGWELGWELENPSTDFGELDF